MAISGNYQQSQQASTTPFAPEYIPQAAAQVGDMVTSAKSAAAAQSQRLQDYIGHLYQLRNLATMAAKGQAARTSGGSQNPLQVYQAMNEMASQAGIPMDAEISKALISGNGIENTLNELLTKAAGLYTNLGSIMKQQSSSEATQTSGTGGSATNVGGGNSGARPQGVYKDINGNVVNPKTTMGASDPGTPSGPKAAATEAPSTGGESGYFPSATNSSPGIETPNFNPQLSGTGENTEAANAATPGSGPIDVGQGATNTLNGLVSALGPHIQESYQTLPGFGNITGSTNPENGSGEAPTGSEFGGGTTNGAGAEASFEFNPTNTGQAGTGNWYSTGGNAESNSIDPQVSNGIANGVDYSGYFS